MVVVPTDDKGRLTGAALDRRAPRRRRRRRRLRRGRHRRHDERRVRRRPRRDRRRRRAARACGSTSTAPTAWRRSRRRAHGTCSQEWSARTRSPSIRTSGSSHRSTARRSCTATLSSARAAHTQHAAYLDVLHTTPDWNPSDYAFHLTRRARGLPFWFSLATHGTDAYAAAIEATLTFTRDVARMIDAHPAVELHRGARAVDRALPARRVDGRGLRGLV